jgi:prolyl oligopeptidase
MSAMSRADGEGLPPVESYPETRVVEQVDVYHGVEVADPYRWLEDDRDPEVEAWVAEQNRVTADYLGGIGAVAEFRQRLGELWDYERHGLPMRRGGRYFFTYNTGLQNQPVLYVSEGLGGDKRVLLDVNELAEDGSVSLAGYSVSEDGGKLAYGLARAGSDWTEWHVRDVDTGEDLGDHLRWVKFSGAAWRRDGSGFYYSRYDEPSEGEAFSGLNENQKLYFHRLGTGQEEDELTFFDPERPRWGYGARVTEDGRYLLLYVREGTDPNNRLYVKDLENEGGEWLRLLDEFDASYTAIDVVGGKMLVLTDLDAPRGRVMEIDLGRPGREHWRELIAEGEDTVEGVGFVGGKLVVEVLRDAHSAVRLHGADGVLEGELELPVIGSVGGFRGRRDEVETFYAYTSYLSPGAIYRLDLGTGESELYWEAEVAFDAGSYETRQIFCESADGERVPVFVTCRKDVKLDGLNPTLLYGYGGFGISLTPGYSPNTAAWLERGGVYAVANLRGGGEYGQEWHQAGTKLNKQRVFEDFVAAAEMLVAEGYCEPGRLGISGGSNGGLLVAACMVQRPELFGCVLPAVGVMDMLRYQEFTIGWAWESDYGRADESAEMFGYLLGYSPYHRLEEGVRYPPVLVTTGDHDDRVVPAHSFKFAARLQACQVEGGPPVLLRVEISAGHGAGKPVAKVLDEAADRWGFLWEALGGVGGR